MLSMLGPALQGFDAISSNAAGSDKRESEPPCALDGGFPERILEGCNPPEPAEAIEMKQLSRILGGEGELESANEPGVTGVARGDVGRRSAMSHFR